MSFDLDKAKAQMDAATKSAEDQLELTKTSIQNQMDAADRIVMRKAAETVLDITPAVAADPT